MSNEETTDHSKKLAFASLISLELIEVASSASFMYIMDIQSSFSSVDLILLSLLQRLPTAMLVSILMRLNSLEDVAEDAVDSKR